MLVMDLINLIMSKMEIGCYLSNEVENLILSRNFKYGLLDFDYGLKIMYTNSTSAFYDNDFLYIIFGGRARLQYS